MDRGDRWHGQGLGTGASRPPLFTGRLSRVLTEELNSIISFVRGNIEAAAAGGETRMAIDLGWPARTSAHSTRRGGDRRKPCCGGCCQCSGQGHERTLVPGDPPRRRKGRNSLYVQASDSLPMGALFLYVQERRAEPIACPAAVWKTFIRRQIRRTATDRIPVLRGMVDDRDVPSSPLLNNRPARTMRAFLSRGRSCDGDR